METRMRGLILSGLLALGCIACGDDDGDATSGPGSSVEGFYLFECEGECAEGGYGGSGIYLSEGKVFDASLAEGDSSLCVWEEIGTYTETADGFRASWPGDEESPARSEDFTLAGDILTGSSYPDEPLERFEGSLPIGDAADCEG
jgi:hypothetical protein